MKSLFDKFDRDEHDRDLALKRDGRKPDDLERAANSSRAIIHDFRKTKSDKTWRMAELQSYVTQRSTASPSSVDRVLRKMKGDGELNYTVIDRSKSIYRFG